MSPLCRLDDIDDPGSRAFVIETPDGRLPLLVVRKDGRVFGYVNSCPHTGAPLDWQAGRFLDVDKRRILCASHGALFRIEDGFCLSGPCAGKTLTPVPLSLVDGEILPVRG